uniref:CYP735A5 n=1 Tax=Arundo donax TaxID=35708 RepID=A0A0A9BHD1_ARUDO
MKCLVPCRCSHDLPVTCACLDDSSSRTIAASVRHTRGSLPYQYTNSLPYALDQRT